MVQTGRRAELRELLGEPIPRAIGKERFALHEGDKEWLAASPFCLIATSDAGGACDVSPKGDPAGFTLVLDDTTIAIPDRPGDRRVDGFLNVLDNPHVGLIYLVPGRNETLRINGRALRTASWPSMGRRTVGARVPCPPRTPSEVAVVRSAPSSSSGAGTCSPAARSRSTAHCSPTVVRSGSPTRRSPVVRSGSPTQCSQAARSGSQGLPGSILDREV
ncbi:pyridoxamine 5'-phosphate oxidase family protein [Sphaerisporangium fuscum]|uniref:pyridoxamine 5'-phosphate oxidase family protein n=1 Tax=Sphaerisporangium fuscum TaxID=2835868 RepID=UPI002029AFCB|nr:pyridoxamine 5'-phosphate oxidase family protein [Sphaerisporangium fuscum]